jgi:signal transduction histidine kinase
LRRVANLTRTVNLDRKGVRLSEHALPMEVQPLVRAVNDMLRRLDESVDKHRFFIATAAHELRTPLTILRSRLEEFPQSDAKAALTSDLQRLSRFVDQLLRLTRLKSDSAIKLAEEDLCQVARDVCAGRAPLAIDRGVELEFETEAPTVLVEGDAQIMSVAISNILDNAISVSRKQDVVTISVTANGCVSVRDRGPGVPAGQEALIFEPFAKDPPTRNGHGLGLAIVAAVMALHNGEAKAKNAPDGGAIFSLRFNPVQPVEDGVPRARFQAGPAIRNVQQPL